MLFPLFCGSDVCHVSEFESGFECCQNLTILANPKSDVFTELLKSYSDYLSVLHNFCINFLQCFDAVGWVAGRAYSL